MNKYSNKDSESTDLIGGKEMASNFKIIRHRNSDNLHLKLFGVFDGTSALELSHVLGGCDKKIRTIFIHTCGLSSIHPFGRDVFLKRMAPSNKISKKLKLTGEFSEQITPEGS